MCMRACESLRPGDFVRVGARSYAQAPAQALPSQKTRTHTGMPGPRLTGPTGEPFFWETSGAGD